LNKEEFRTVCFIRVKPRVTPEPLRERLDSAKISSAAADEIFGLGWSAAEAPGSQRSRKFHVVRSHISPQRSFMRTRFYGPNGFDGTGRWMLFNFLLAVLLLPPAKPAAAAEASSAIGLWQDADATFEIYDEQGTLSGKIVSLREERTAEGMTKTDIHNPDPSKRTRSIVGLIVMAGFVKKSDTHWENGTIYDPRNGSTYSCTLDLDGPNRIKVRGFVGISLLGRTETWTRAAK
jgi:uncharacterized protein (DUF2147 family)